MLLLKQKQSFRTLLEREGHICRPLLTYLFVVVMFLDVTFTSAGIGLVLLFLQVFSFFTTGFLFSSIPWPTELLGYGAVDRTVHNILSFCVYLGFFYLLSSHLFLKLSILLECVCYWEGRSNLGRELLFYLSHKFKNSYCSGKIQELTLPSVQKSECCFTELQNTPGWRCP